MPKAPRPCRFAIAAVPTPGRPGCLGCTAFPPTAHVPWDVARNPPRAVEVWDYKAPPLPLCKDGRMLAGGAGGAERGHGEQLKRRAMTLTTAKGLVRETPATP